MKSGRAGNPSSPSVPKDARDLIRLMSRANPTWGAPRIHGELLKLGMNIGETSVSKYLVHQRKPPSQTWRTILENHVKDLVSVDFFTVPTPAQAIGLEEAGPDRLRPPIPAAPAKPFRDVNEEPSAEEGCSGTTESCIP